MFAPTNMIQIRDIKNVTPGSTATINCPKGNRYRRLLIGLQDTGSGVTTAPAVSTITSGDMTITLGSKIIRRATGAQVDLINTLNGNQYASYGVAGAANGGGITYLPIFFEEPWRKRADFQNGLACCTDWLGTNDVFSIQIPIAAGTTTPVLTCMAIVDAFGTGKPNPIMKWFANDSPTSSNTVDLANIFQGAPPTDMVETISMLNTSDAKFVAKARLTINNQLVLDDLTFDQQTAYLKEADMNPTGTSLTGANAFHFVLDHDDLFESLRPISSITASDLYLTLSTSSSGTIRVIQQRLGDPTQ
jgi:Viral coat protein P2 N-terminal domain